MVMNGFDTNFDDENEFYAVNSIPFAYIERPIRIERARPVRIYLVNITEFDPINSFHLHGNFFDYYDHGTTLTPTSPHDRHGDAVPGPARHPRDRATPRTSRASTCSTPTSPSSPSSAG